MSNRFGYRQDLGYTSPYKSLDDEHPDSGLLQETGVAEIGPYFLLETSLTDIILMES